MHLLERMAHDGGWPKLGGWRSGNISYECGTQFAVNALGFLSAVYLWAYLTLDWDGTRWVSCTNTTDPIYEQLQFTDQFFEPGSSSTLADQLWFALPLFSFPDYIGYCTTHRENDPTVPWADKVPGVINAHAQALHFVAMMRDAARLKGDTAASDAWRDRLVRFHRGSKAMFDLMHPGTDPNNSSIRLPGLMNYGVYQQHIHNTHAYAYSALTYGGLPLGYLQAGER